ncbi:ABC transporter permease [Dactylosporangium sp. AC04546]|uniref:ABC transporter permease n=1 Tax=Dactylosporangium sp. AC04546 TaxID=2862460 RepID=UPI001EDCD303|nr:ABC transporter permease [Dactylosporangium sp. AC04546]WVK80661.1 ABC transporter permease [Dactylosporangium sp. AC04546]
MVMTTENRSGHGRRGPGGAATRTIAYQPGQSELDPQRAHRRRQSLEISLAVAVPIALLGLWQAASDLGWIDARLYPTPVTIAQTGWRLSTEGVLWHDVFATMRRVLFGWGIGSVTGAVLGLLMGWAPLVRRALEPTLDALYVVPKLALLPILFNIFGLGERSQIALVAVTVFFFVWIATMAAIMSVPIGYRDSAVVFGAGRWQMFRHVLLPASLPQTLVGMRVAAGVAVLVIVAAEFLVGQDGLGYLIFNSRNLFINDEMFVGIVLVALFGVLFAQLIRWVSRFLVPWAPEDRGAPDN